MRPLQSASIGREQEEHWDPGWSSGHIQRQAWVSRNRHLGAGWRSRSPVALHVCVSTGAPWQRRPGHCPPFHAPLPPATSTDCPCPMGGMAIPRPIVRANRPLRFLGRAPPCSPLTSICFVTFQVRHCPLCRSITGDSVGNWPAITPSPSRPHWRSNSDHAGKRYSGEIESWIATCELRMHSKPSTNRSWKFDNRLYIFKTGYRLETG